MFTNGMVAISKDGYSFTLTGGNSGSALGGSTFFSGIAPSDGGILQFSYSFQSSDKSGEDNAGYLIGGVMFELTHVPVASTPFTFTVTGGESYGWFADTMDNQGGAGVLTVVFSTPSVSGVPEPGTVTLLVIAGALLPLKRRASVSIRTLRSLAVLPCVALFIGTPASLSAQSQSYYLGLNITGQLSLSRAVSVAPAVAAQSQSAVERAMSLQMSPAGAREEASSLPSRFPHPPLSRYSEFSGVRARPGSMIRSLQLPIATPDLSSITTGLGFNALSHYDQRLANGGNQFSVEPPNPSIAAANGYLLEGVNNAIQVYDSTSGTPRIQTLSSNELFGVAASFNRTTGAKGVYPTDMRVFYDNDISRWFVLQRSQDNDINGTPLNRSHLYLAVSQTSAPIGTYNIYVMDTTDLANPDCPCVADFPQIGSDQYGFHISMNEYDTSSLQFVDVRILAVSKLALATGAVAPTMFGFSIWRANGYEFSLQPAAAPKGGFQFLADGGVEYFLSSQSAFAVDSHVAIWALSNTASLQSQNPSLLLTQSTIDTLMYTYPDFAVQKAGPIPYGSSFFPPAPEAYIDGGPDSRILSLEYTDGCLFTTLATEITDAGGHHLVGGAYMILSPTFRNGIVAGTVVKQGYLSIANNNLLRPAIAVNPQGRGAIGFTITGPDYYPSAAFATIDLVTDPSAIQISGAGSLPEDGFTGYPGGSFAGIARWGDYSTASVDTDGSIWMVSEYISSGPRTTSANWGTFVTRYIP